jgi:hypothetical protein
VNVSIPALQPDGEAEAARPLPMIGIRASVCIPDLP